ncbi:hypothetical protein RJ639_008385 [Escallonia herrerae]|uniref:Uncharacterized protein n=1 Tax=Escallonia herrerae TaxID=1293975 RepID=A0AA89ATN6_9ASTE|nr:hypothetical protein RJ639_008385 [Escallonia herrerae]
MAPPRILLCGDVNIRLNQLVKRIQLVNKSAGPFDALLCVGFKMDGLKICENLYWLKGSGMFTLNGITS